MASEALTQVRNRLQSFVAGIDTAMATPDLVSAFRDAHADVIASASLDLESIALTKLINEVSSRRHLLSRDDQGDLFLGFSMRSAILVKVGKGKKARWMRQPSLTATYAQVKAFLAREPKAKKIQKDSGMRATLERVRPYLTSSDMVMADALAAAKAADNSTALVIGR